MNKAKFIRTALYSAGVLLYGSWASAAEVVVRIDNPPESGVVALALFDSANAFGDLRDPYMVVMHSLDAHKEYIMEDVAR